MGFALGGMLGVTSLISVDRDDGTLLRAKATPGGMTAYVINKIVYISATQIVGLAITLVIGLVAFPGVHVTAAGLATLVWVTIGGLLATIPIGITLGSMLPNPRFIPLRHMARRESGSRVAARRERAMLRAS